MVTLKQKIENRFQEYESEHRVTSMRITEDIEMDVREAVLEFKKCLEKDFENSWNLQKLKEIFGDFK